MGYKWNPNCKVIYVRKGKQVEHAANLRLDDTTLVETRNVRLGPNTRSWV